MFTISFCIHSNRDTDHNLAATCNVDCGCSAMVYEPVCGLDGSQYFSPCHAGCSSKHSFIKSPMGPIKVTKREGKERKGSFKTHLIVE